MDEQQAGDREQARELEQQETEQQETEQQEQKRGMSQTLGDGFSIAPSVLCFKPVQALCAKSAAPP